MFTPGDVTEWKRCIIPLALDTQAKRASTRPLAFCPNMRAKRSLLDVLGEIGHSLLVCLGEPRDRYHRAAAGHARPSHPQVRLARAAAWLRCPAAHSTDFQKPPADSAGLALPRAVSPRASGAHRLRMG